ncbi:MAG: hypothetical protein HZA90_25370 [Verrucomicrobia bacterium]|nr:hypothetical protein [Verrucomicrobiota bacterium]
MVAALALPAATRDTDFQRQQLLQDAHQDPAATSPRAARLRYVPTNTLAFRDYALSVMLTQANHLNRQWQLGIAPQIATEHITRLDATPMVAGIAGGITVSNRFRFAFTEGKFVLYQDGLLCWQDTERDISQLKALSKQRSLLSLRQATEIAKQALRGLGLTPAQFRLMETPVTQQYSYTSVDEKAHPVPVFLVQWKPTPKAQFNTIRIEVSGLTKTVVAYENYLAPPLPLPTNYFQMLGISPDRGKWGAQFGYDPHHTAAFEHFARAYAVAQMNHLVQAWQLDYPRLLTTNDIAWFYAKPGTNAPFVCAGFTNRFYLQMMEGFVDLFEDRAHNQSLFSEDPSKLHSRAVMSRKLDEKTAIQLARDTLHRLGLDEKQLRLREPPTVTQVDFPGDKEDETVLLPLYTVAWHFPPGLERKFGEMKALGVQVSAVTKRAVMFANNCPWTPKLPLPTNYLEIIGVTNAPSEAGSKPASK